MEPLRSPVEVVVGCLYADSGTSAAPAPVPNPGQVELDQFDNQSAMEAGDVHGAVHADANENLHGNGVGVYPDEDNAPYFMIGEENLFDEGDESSDKDEELEGAGWVNPS
jgi:hypothetical protein